MYFIGILFLIIVIIAIWFRIPFSPLRSEFQEDVEKMKRLSQVNGESLLTESDFSKLPEPVQKYVDACGYIGIPKMSCLHMEYKDVAFKQGINGPQLKIDYMQYNSVAQPNRLAFIDSSMFGIPFQGYDYYEAGKGGMKGVIAKSITLFDQTGEDMDKACLVTFMAESLFAPTMLLQDYFTFEELNDYQVKATISFDGQTASGIFSFNENYEYTSFTTNDRAVANGDGTMEYVPWTAKCSDYYEAENGIKYPATFCAIWNYPENDFVYFDGKISFVGYEN